ncbi:MAG: hypothetical protein K6E75_09115 [Lachnospiraceae bacterium]|nr:hypothetical protein [Lachnospiraceae bacterium]
MCKNSEIFYLFFLLIFMAGCYLSCGQSGSVTAKAAVFEEEAEIGPGAAESEMAPTEQSGTAVSAGDHSEPASGSAADPDSTSQDGKQECSGRGVSERENVKRGNNAADKGNESEKHKSSGVTGKAEKTEVKGTDDADTADDMSHNTDMYRTGDKESDENSDEQEDRQSFSVPLKEGNINEERTGEKNTEENTIQERTIKEKNIESDSSPNSDGSSSAGGKTESETADQEAKETDIEKTPAVHKLPAGLIVTAGMLMLSGGIARRIMRKTY